MYSSSQESYFRLMLGLFGMAVISFAMGAWLLLVQDRWWSCLILTLLGAFNGYLGERSLDRLLNEPAEAGNDGGYDPN